MRDRENGRPVGRVVGLWRYPVKSMAGEPLTEVDVSWHGFAGDRRWAFIRDGLPQSGFPWLTLRERGDMSHYHPSFVDPAQPDKSPTTVRTPAGTVFDVTDPALATQLWPEGARVIKQNRGIFDTFPLSLVTTQTLARLGEMVGAPLEVQRFRPNILVEAARSGSVPGRRLGRLCPAYRRHGHARRQTRRPLRRHHDRSRDHAAQSGDPAHGRPGSPGLPRRLRLDGDTWPRSRERSCERILNSDC